MKFFLPQVKNADYSDVYDAIVRSIEDQMRIKLKPNRIFRLQYVHDKRLLTAEVGKPDPQQGRYEVFAIFEAKPFIVFTRGKNGEHGLTMLVSGDEITEIEYFDE